jgi:hypothetical protein
MPSSHMRCLGLLSVGLPYFDIATAARLAGLDHTAV